MHELVGIGEEKGFHFRSFFSNTETNFHTSVGNRLYMRLPTGLFRLNVLMVSFLIFLLCLGREAVL